MEFFVPNIDDASKAEKFYQGVKKFSEDTLGWSISNRRIFSLRYRHDGTEILAQVGEKDIDGEIVIAIFDASQSYVICTPNRGGLRGDPILAGKDRVSDIDR